MRPPVLAYVCGDCGAVLRMSCDDCEGREHDSRAEERHAEEESRAWMLDVPGVRRMKERAGIDITLSSEPDEDGEEVFDAAAAIQVGSMAQRFLGTSRKSYALAVEALRLDLVHFLNAVTAAIDDPDYNPEA